MRFSNTISSGFLVHRVTSTPHQHQHNDNTQDQVFQLQNLENLGLINDDMYSEMKSKTYLRRGYSLNKIKMSLSLKGIDPERLKKTIDNIKKENEDPDFYSAIKICKKMNKINIEFTK